MPNFLREILLNVIYLSHSILLNNYVINETSLPVAIEYRRAITAVLTVTKLISDASFALQTVTAHASPATKRNSPVDF